MVVVTHIAWRTVDAGLHHVVPSHLCPLVFGFLHDNQLLEMAKKFTKVTGTTQRDANASSLLDIYSFWLNSHPREDCTQKASHGQSPSESSCHPYPRVPAVRTSPMRKKQTRTFQKKKKKKAKTRSLQFSPPTFCSSTKEVCGNPHFQENCGEETACGKQ
uniref:Uncharacterized protein n=1 Tax=Piliocolobus tephrosceles TaxID=591936 RepID=A0A8C9I2Q9_9PRIM